MADFLGLIGTAKGLVVYELSDQGSPALKDIHFPGFSTNMIFVDQRNGRWWIGLSHKHWGQKLHYSDDLGKTWMEATMPSLHGQTLPNGKPAKLRQIWCMASAGNDRSGELWLGTDPGALFHSKDNGGTFELVKTLWDHPSRQKEGQWFGAGSDYPFIHSIVVDPTDSSHVYIAVSCAGVFETRDGGKSWTPRNRGLRAAYLPNPNVEVGHDPHLLLMSPADPQVLWQQNHCGIYYSLNGGEEWNDCSNTEGVPSYGFAIAIDDEDAKQAWVIPVESDEQRIAPNLKLDVFHTDDYGVNWHHDSDGLPDAPTFDIVLRHSFVKKKGHFLFGTTNGNLFYRNGRNARWELINTHLTKVNSVLIYQAYKLYCIQ